MYYIMQGITTQGTAMLDLRSYLYIDRCLRSPLADPVQNYRLIIIFIANLSF